MKATTLTTINPPDQAPDLDDMREYFEERAAILEFDHGLSREGAEAEALRRTIEHFGVSP